MTDEEIQRLHEENPVRHFYRTGEGKVVYLDSPESEIRPEDVINYHKDGSVACLKNGDVCF